MGELLGVGYSLSKSDSLIKTFQDVKLENLDKIQFKINNIKMICLKILEAVRDLELVAAGCAQTRFAQPLLPQCRVSIIILTNIFLTINQSKFISFNCFQRNLQFNSKIFWLICVCIWIICLFYWMAHFYGWKDLTRSITKLY